MNKRVTVCCLVIVIIVVGGALVSSLLGGGQGNADAKAIIFPGDVKHDNFDWASVLSSMPIYQAKTQTKKAQRAEKVTSLLDAKLVAVVSDSLKTATLLIPEDKNLTPITIKIGEGWLENWTLKTINTDHIVWQSSVSKDTQTQYLYE